MMKIFFFPAQISTCVSFEEVKKQVKGCFFWPPRLSQGEMQIEMRSYLRLHGQIRARGYSELDS